MKIKTRDANLVSTGFILGALFATALLWPSKQPGGAWSSRPIVTGTILASSSSSSPLGTNFQFSPRMEEMPEVGDGLYPQHPLKLPAHRPVDLIDFNYKPDIPPADLN